MILSMTGFGRGTAVRSGREITVELRSVNSRYFEYSSRIPRTCSYLDSRLKKQLNERITRGKVELSMTIQNVDAADTVVTVNMELARSYQQAMRDLSEQLGVKNDISAAVLTRFPDVLATRHADVDEEQLWEDVSAVTAQALDCFVEMRAAEGAKMKADVENRLNFLEECVGKVETLSAGRVEAYTNRLYEKLKVILEDRDIDDARVLTEAAIFGDKTAVDEETVRLRSHISQYRGILQLNEPVGRKLDFLTQELNRETNTIGSKCQDLDITRIVVDMKAEIEKIREQIQNLEGSRRFSEECNEADQHRVWQYGQRGPGRGSGQPGFCAGQASCQGSAGARHADRRFLWAQHPCRAHHGFRSCGALGPSAGNGGQPCGRAGEQGNNRGGTDPWRRINFCLSCPVPPAPVRTAWSRHCARPIRRSKKPCLPPPAAPAPGSRKVWITTTAPRSSSVI